MQDIQPTTASLQTPLHPVLDLLTHRLEEPWSVERLAQALGVSTRTLHRVFTRQYGLSPMLVLRRMRLATARQRLQSPDPGTTVTTAAFDSGFAHLGRFSQEYARRFGERPSETLRGARQRRACCTTSAVPAAAVRPFESRGAA